MPLARDPNSLYMRRRAQGLCGQCGENKPVGNRAICESCAEAGRERHSAWRQKVVELGVCTRCGKEPVCGESRVNCRKCFRGRRVREKENRNKVLDLYGTVCACCGLGDRRFLTVDHTNNDGRFDRALRGDANVRILKTKPTGIQILCWNCNMAKGIFRGTCPHQIAIIGDSWIVRKVA